MAEAKTKEVQSKETNWDERVELMIPRDMSNPNDGEVSIIVNGKIFQIQRGVTVQVPRYVKQAYLDSEAQKAVAYERQQKAAEHKQD